MIFITITRATEIDCYFLGLTQFLQADSYGTATLGNCRNFAVDCTISGTEHKYRYRSVIIIKWRLRTGTGHILRENPGM